MSPSPWEFRGQALQPSLSSCQRTEEPKQMAKAWEGPEIFKTQRSVAQVLGLGGGKSLCSTPGELWGSRDGHMVKPWPQLVLKLSEAACRILPQSTETDFPRPSQRATVPICLPDKSGRHWLSYPNSGLYKGLDAYSPSASKKEVIRPSWMVKGSITLGASTWAAILASGPMKQ